MVAYCLKIAPHYSGLVCGHFPDIPGLMVMGRDLDEVEELAVAALEAELESQLERNGRIPKPRTRGRLRIATARFG